jgi:hypothetical protein
VNCVVCGKPLEPPLQRLCFNCREEFRQTIIKQLGGEEGYQKLLCWPKEEKKDAKR